MSTFNPFAPFSLPFIYIFTIVVLLLAFEMGYQFGGPWKRRSPTTTEGAVGSVAGIILGLLAFLLAFIVSFAANRFDDRKALVMDDATSTRKVVLRAQLLGEPAQSEVRALLTEYVDIRLDAIESSGDLAPAEERSNEILNQVWAIAAQAGANGGSESISLFIDSVNDLMTVNTSRTFLTINYHLPYTILAAIYLIAFLSMVLEGAQSRFQGSRNLVSMVVLVIVLSVVILLIFDLDRTTEGFLQISQQPMIDLQTELHAQP